METHGWTEENYKTTGEERDLDLPTFLSRLHHLNTHGLPVRLSVTPITSDWQRLLMINVHALPGFVHLGTWARVVTHYHAGRHYHISLCYVSELPRDGAAAYERIRERYDGMRGVLSVAITNSAADLTDASTLSHELLNDPDITMLHNSGKYSTRPLHVSL
jgi:hypothetical protein